MIIKDPTQYTGGYGKLPMRTHTHKIIIQSRQISTCLITQNTDLVIESNQLKRMIRVSHFPPHVSLTGYKLNIIKPAYTS